ncbi:MAG: FAD-binding protein [Betaproteobacteria bacterium]|nr:FAD-binding protein [Betaproteobacteria bacterium]
MTAARSAVVVGGGIAGMSSAIMLKRKGLEVLLIDVATDWKMTGAGLTISPPTLRALEMLDLIDEVQLKGHIHAGIRVCDSQGLSLCDLPSPYLEGAKVQGAGGILRSTLHDIMSRRLVELNVPVRLGLTVIGIDKQGATCRLQLSDGTDVVVDLVVGADGLYSGLRQLLFPKASKPAFTGQACWRLVIPRLPQIEMRHFFLGGRCKVGRPLEAHLLRQDWWIDNVILIGDASHATTPQLASGAGMALEDGIVLAEEVSLETSLPKAFANFMMRRFERCRLVVENSLEIGRLEISGATAKEQTAVVERSLKALALPI